MTLLSKTECSALRGIAITGIFLHNYLHWLNPMLKENEYLFRHNNVEAFKEFIFGNAGGNDVLQLFSFFGHYGVPVFLFLSGYGLVLKYEKNSADKDITSASSFLWKHFMKLFPMMLLGFVVFYVIDQVTPNPFHWTWENLIRNLTMTANLFPLPSQNIYPGPYWFFGLIMQLYIIYRFIFFERSNIWIYGAIILCLVIQLCCIGNTEGETLRWIRYNSIGGVLPFGIGVLLARYEKRERIRISLEKLFAPKYAGIIAVVSLIIIIFGSLNFVAWLWVPAFVVTLHIGVIKLFRGKGLGLLSWLGAVSSAIFVCHPITRKLVIPISRHGEILEGLVIYIIATLLLAIIFRFVIKNINRMINI